MTDDLERRLSLGVFEGAIPMKMHRQRRRFLRSRKRFAIIPAGRRCLAEGTLVATPTGPRTIESLRVGDEVIGFDGELPVATRVTKTWDNGVQEVVGLVSRHRCYLEATANHRLWACDESALDKRRQHLGRGYDRVEVGDLTRRDRVRRVYLGDLIQGGAKHVDRAYSLGALLGDGCSRDGNFGRWGSRQRTLSISSDDETVPAAVAEQIGGTFRRRHANNYSWDIRVASHALDAVPFYREWCAGRYAHEKVVDWGEVDTWDRESCLALLAGIVDTDGSIYFKSASQRELVVQIGMQARSVVDACRRIILKFFQDDLQLSVDHRGRYKNGPVYCLKSTSNDSSIRIVEALRPHLRKKGGVDISKLQRSNVRGDRIGLTHGVARRCRTFDITVALPSNLYVLHVGGIVTSNSGKTVEARHRLLFGSKHFGGNHHGCLTPPTDVADPTFVYGAPTYAQAKRIVWERFKAEIPKWAIRQKSESELWIRFVTGAILYVVGMDRPERAEGIPIDGLVLDEFADMKPSAWYSSTRPTLSTPGRLPGWALFIGRPRGMGHFGKLFKDAQDPKNVPDWDVFYPWPSWLVMDPNEVAAARRDLDERSFRQEYGGEFLDDIGRAYYQFGPWNLRDVAYNPTRPLQFAFDFNVNPGVAVVAQDLDQVVELLVCYRCSAPMPGKSGEPCRFCSTRLPYETVTGVLGEVFRWQIASNTRLVCEELIEKWGPVHRGGVICYGDPSGGARHTSSERSDWQTIEDYLSRQWPVFEMDLPSADPGIRDRLVVTNSRLKNASDQVRIYIDPAKAPHLIEDLENTQLKPNGDIDEGPDRKNSHLSDALAYQQHQRFGSPVNSQSKAFAVTAL